MKTDGGLTTKIHLALAAVLRRFPRLRLWARKRYWKNRRSAYQAIATRIDTDPTVVFFESFNGRNFACSPRALYECMLADSRFDSYTFVWSFKEGFRPTGEPLLERAAIVQRGSQEYYEALALASTIILNNRLPEYVDPKPGQTYVQCWHGTPLKRLGYDVEVETTNVLNTSSELAYRFGMDSAKWSYLLSPSPYASQHLADAFGLPAERRASTILEFGYPRNDCLIRARKASDSTQQAREALRIPPNKKVLLYAPTWRDDSYIDGVGYSMDLLVDLEKLREAIGNEWIVLFRAHYYIANSFDFSALGSFVVDASNRGDINQLYIASDALVTDYSSVIFDYAALRRPMVLFCPDIDEYAGATRGFYFDIHEVPGPLCTTTDELCEAMLALDTYWDRHDTAYNAFLKRFCPHDGGDSSQRVIDVIFGEAER